MKKIISLTVALLIKRERYLISPNEGGAEKIVYLFFSLFVSSTFFTFPRPKT